ncbi:unnamed protein product [Lasius platythorax]|uniref:Uncharacterized protein n=2 Tax=Lasius platythorax TaxID=488582 RepID=A0AAV2NF68_9HYME
MQMLSNALNTIAMNKLLKIGGSSIYNFTQRALKMLPKEHQPCLELQQELTDMTRKYNAAKEKVAKYKAALQEKKSELEVIRQLNEQLQKKVIDKLKKCQISHSLERNRRLHMMKFHVCTYSPRTTATQNGFI